MTGQDATTARPGGGSASVKGMAIMAGGVLLLPGLDAFAKLAAETMTPAEVVWFRLVLQAVLILPLVLWRHRAWPRVRRPGVHAVRGVLLAMASLFFITALRHLPMAETVAIFFIEPLILTLISGLFLGERVGWRRVAAVLVGLGGALVIIRPSFAVFGAVALLPAGTALCFAVYLALSRSLSSDGDAITMQFTAGIAGSLVMSVVLATGTAADLGFLSPVVPDLRGILLLLGMGVVGTLGHLLLTQAFRLAPASLLAPFQYLEIVSATVLGFLIFGDLPDGPTLVGAAIIVGAGLYVFRRERRAPQPASREIPMP